MLVTLDYGQIGVITHPIQANGRGRAGAAVRL